MKTRINYIMVGLFVLTLTTALIAGILWLASGGAGRAYDEYLVYMEESVSGLSHDSTVKYYGVDVGRVHSITLDADDQRRVRLLLQIDEGTPVREDTVASLETQGLTGLAYINLTGGSPASPPLQAAADEDYPVIRSEPSVWGRLDQSLGILVDNLIEASQRLNRVLSDENQQTMEETLADVRTLTALLAERAESLGVSLDDMAETARHFKQTSASLPGLIDRIESTAASLDEMAGEISRTAVTVRETVASGGADLQGFTGRTLPEITQMARELRIAAENLRRFSEKLERDPGILLHGAPAVRPGPGE